MMLKSTSLATYISFILVITKMKSNQNMVIILKKNQSLDDMDKNQSRSHGYKKTARA